ncbi:hypothetical protein EON63_02350 [archaeon]|nr:MAG: hypothetical protein EON63_02350 [archaeon]
MDQRASLDSLSRELRKVQDKVALASHEQDDELIRALEKLLRVMKQHHNLQYPFLVCCCYYYICMHYLG